MNPPGGCKECAVMVSVTLLFPLCITLPAAVGARDSQQIQVSLPPMQGTGPTAEILGKQAVAGDWIAETEVPVAGRPAHLAFIFATQPGSEVYLALHLYTDRTELVRHSEASSSTLAHYQGAGPPPWQLNVRRRGAYYLFTINGSYLGFTFHPSGDLDRSAQRPSATEPKSTRLGISFPSVGEYRLGRFTVHAISFGKRRDQPIIAPGPAGSWDQAEAFPGAVIEYEGTYYLYLNGTDWTSEKLEGSGNTRVGLATSKDLLHWEVDPRGVVLGLGPKGSWDSTLVMVNGATRTPEGKFAVTYMGFNGKTWSGIGLATADRPAGPFTKYSDNPVLRTVPASWESVIHEHTLYRDGNRYILFYTGFDGRKGDRGGLAVSEDLVHWTQDPANPVFRTEGPNRWDSLHLRPRSLFRRGDYFYLFYEGAGMREKFIEAEGGVETGKKLVFDSVGLARSKDLHTWERYPWNPAIAQTGDKTFDALWTGWPHAVARPDGLFIFYAASDAWGFAKKQGRVYTGLMHFDYQELENWDASR